MILDLELVLLLSSKPQLWDSNIDEPHGQLAEPDLRLRDGPVSVNPLKRFRPEPHRLVPADVPNESELLIDTFLDPLSGHAVYRRNRHPDVVVGPAHVFAHT